MERTAKDYAIEFGGYLADAARNFQFALNAASPHNARPDRAPELLT